MEEMKPKITEVDVVDCRIKLPDDLRILTHVFVLNPTARGIWVFAFRKQQPENLPH